MIRCMLPAGIKMRMAMHAEQRFLPDVQQHFSLRGRQAQQAASGSRRIEAIQSLIGDSCSRVSERNNGTPRLRTLRFAPSFESCGSSRYRLAPHAGLVATCCRRAAPRPRSRAARCRNVLSPSGAAVSLPGSAVSAGRRRGLAPGQRGVCWAAVLARGGARLGCRRGRLRKVLWLPVGSLSRAGQDPHGG